MRWQHKARIQNLVAKLPAPLGRRVYYLLQRHWGALRQINPLERLRSGLAILDHVRRQGQDLEAATFLEVGTGRRLNVPIALWLGGAERIITTDLNPYLKAELVREDLAWMRSHADELESLFSDCGLAAAFHERFPRLPEGDGGLAHVLETIHVRYLPSAAAGRLPLPSGSIDYHVSCAVLEHVPATDLSALLVEGKRVLRRGGLFIHFVDFGDHFAPQDATISAINFLRFDERQWAAYAGNRYMYHNRLRVDDLVELIRRTGLCPTVADAEVDPRALEELRAGFPLDARFAGKPPETNATATAWVIAPADGDGEPQAECELGEARP